MNEIIDGFKVELANDLLMIKKVSNGMILKADTVTVHEADQKFKDLCQALKDKIAERKAKGLDC
jgi:tryptophan synthase alpha subunit|tara:strand:- start:53 stop:244 length:192 start_codon:yes stop_codon:yes gene_type:complete